VAKRETRFKSVTYPTGDWPRVRFRLPEEWVEDYADPEVGLFYEEPDLGGGPWPIGGMLHAFRVRKSVEAEWTPATFAEYVTSRFAAAKPRLLLDGSWLTRVIEFKQEEGHRAAVHQWQRLVARGREVVSFGWCFTGVAGFYGASGDCYYGVVEMLAVEVERAEVIDAAP
jgi:hypothetical protein